MLELPKKSWSTYLISKEQEKLAFLKLELRECAYVVQQLKENNSGRTIAADIKEWEAKLKQLTDQVFEMNILLGIDV